MRDPARKALRDARVFGTVLTLILGAWAAYGVYRGALVRAQILAAGTASVVVLMLGLPRVWVAIHGAWMRAGRFVLSRVTIALLFVFFYLVITPYGWLSRRRGEDEFGLDRDPSRGSFWVERPPPTDTDRERCERMY